MSDSSHCTHFWSENCCKCEFKKKKTFCLPLSGLCIVFEIMQSIIPHYKCFQRMFSYQCWRVQYTLHRQVWNMQQPISEFWTDQTARPQTIKYVQSRRSNFRQDSIQWMTHSQHWYHLRTTLCTWEICLTTVFILQPRICVWANPSCTVMRAMLSVIRWTSYKRISVGSVVLYVIERLSHVWLWYLELVIILSFCPFILISMLLFFMSLVFSALL